MDAKDAKIAQAMSQLQTMLKKQETKTAALKKLESDVAANGSSCSIGKVLNQRAMGPAAQCQRSSAGPARRKRARACTGAGARRRQGGVTVR